MCHRLLKQPRKKTRKYFPIDCLRLGDNELLCRFYNADEAAEFLYPDRLPPDAHTSTHTQAPQRPSTSLARTVANIKACVQGRSKSAWGFFWRLAPTDGNILCAAGSTVKTTSDWTRADLLAHKFHTVQPVDCMQCESGEVLCRFDSIDEAVHYLVPDLDPRDTALLARKMANIKACIQGRMKSSYGYGWRLAPAVDNQCVGSSVNSSTAAPVRTTADWARADFLAHKFRVVRPSRTVSMGAKAVDCVQCSNAELLCRFPTVADAAAFVHPLLHTPQNGTDRSVKSLIMSLENLQGAIIRCASGAQVTTAGFAWKWAPSQFESSDVVGSVSVSTVRTAADWSPEDLLSCRLVAVPATAVEEPVECLRCEDRAFLCTFSCPEDAVKFLFPELFHPTGQAPPDQADRSVQQLITSRAANLRLCIKGARKTAFGFSWRPPSSDVNDSGRRSNVTVGKKLGDWTREDLLLHQVIASLHLSHAYVPTSSCDSSLTPLPIFPSSFLIFFGSARAQMEVGSRAKKFAVELNVADSIRNSWSTSSPP